MGIPRGSARLLLLEAKSRPFSGTVLQLGRSSVYFTQSELEGWARRDGVELAPVGSVALSHDPRLARQGCLADTSFFEQLGFDAVESCDVESWEGADHIVDLNEPIPAELEGRFDAVFETGTIVQIFDLPRVLENLHRLVKPGGRIIHCAVPSNNHMDLGFYMLCPTFFADYYSANGYALEASFLCEYFAYWHHGRLYSDRWRIYDYEPGALDALSYGRYGGAQAASFVIARKSEGATAGVSPQLGQYRRAWQKHAEPERDPNLSAGQVDSDAGVRDTAWRPLAVAAKRVAETVRRRLLPRNMPRLRYRL